MSGIGLTGSLLMGARSLNTQRVGIEVAGNNLANINTPNSARQRVDIQQDVSLTVAGQWQQGMGSFANNIESLRSQLLDKQIVRQQSLSGFYETKQNLANLVEDMLGENFTTSEASQIGGPNSLTGVQNSLNSLFDSFQSLSNDPTSIVARNEVLSRADNVLKDIAAIYNRVLDTRDGIFEEASSTTSELNSLSTQIALVNGEIARAEVVTGKTANDLRDRRQELIEQMAKIANIQVTENLGNPPGMVDIALKDNSSITLVKGVYGGGNGTAADVTYALSVDQSFDRTTNNLLQIRATPNAGATVLLTANNPSPNQPSEGELGAQLDVANRIIGSGTAAGDNTLMERLNQFATNLRLKVNAAHSVGFDLDNATGVNFFSTTGDPEALGLQVAITDPRDIAAAASVNSPLDNAQATALANLRYDENLSQAHRDLVGGVGIEISKARRDNEAQQLIQKQIFQEREGVSGISTDEEMTNLTRFQRAYEASAKFINVIDEMMLTVIGLGAR